MNVLVFEGGHASYDDEGEGFGTFYGGRGGWGYSPYIEYGDIEVVGKGSGFGTGVIFEFFKGDTYATEKGATVFVNTDHVRYDGFGDSRTFQDHSYTESKYGSLYFTPFTGIGVGYGFSWPYKKGDGGCGGLDEF